MKVFTKHDKTKIRQIENMKLILSFIDTTKKIKSFKMLWGENRIWNVVCWWPMEKLLCLKEFVSQVSSVKFQFPILYQQNMTSPPPTTAITAVGNHW